MTTSSLVLQVEATPGDARTLTFGVLNHDRDKCLERSEVASFVRERLSIEEFDDDHEVESAVQSIFRNHNSTKDQCISGAEFNFYLCAARPSRTLRLASRGWPAGPLALWRLAIAD